jgi:hypothetical protein
VIPYGIVSTEKTKNAERSLFYILQRFILMEVDEKMKYFEPKVAYLYFILHWNFLWSSFRRIVWPRGNALVLYSGGVRFESSLNRRVSWSRFLLLLLSPSTHSGIVPRLGHDQFLLLHFQFICHLSIPGYIVSIMETLLTDTQEGSSFQPVLILYVNTILRQCHILCLSSTWALAVTKRVSRTSVWTSRHQ